MLLTDARDLISGAYRYTLTLQAGRDFYSVHHRDGQFILALSRDFAASRHIVEETEWHAFLAKIADEIKTCNEWIKQ